MAKDYAKFVPKQRPLKKKSKGKDYLFFAFLLLMIFVVGGGFLFKKQSHLLLTSNTVKNSFVDKALTFLHHQNKPQQITSKVEPKKIAMAGPNQPPPVQFDFYSELPNMQVTLPEAAPALKAVAENKPVKVIPEKIQKPEKAEKPVIAAATKPNIFTQTEFTDMIEAENHAAHFVIQLGEFETAAGAHRLLEAIQSVGFAPEVVKTKQGPHTKFAVQQGPFDSISVARATQARMQKRGIVSVIRKTA